MRKQLARLSAGIGLAALLCGGALSASASGTYPGIPLQASYPMDQTPTPGGVVTDAAGSHDGQFADNTTVTKVAAVDPYAGTSAYSFPGWDDGSFGTVDATASSVVVPDSDALNPDASDFEVSFWMDPQNPNVDPTIVACAAQPVTVCHADLNVMQKGLGNADQWKLELGSDGTIFCDFRDGRSGAKVRVNDHGQTVAAHGWKGPFFVSCALVHDGGPNQDQGEARLVVGYDVDAAHSTASNPVKCYSTLDASNSGPSVLPVGADVVPQGDMWIGKKPQTQPLTSADGKAYAGTLDDLQISKGTITDTTGSSCS